VFFYIKDILNTEDFTEDRFVLIVLGAYLSSFHWQITTQIVYYK